jgi:hypothetical protein
MSLPRRLDIIFVLGILLPTLILVKPCRSQSSLESRKTLFTQRLSEAVSKVEDHLSRNADGLEIRDLTNGSLAAILLGRPALAETWLKAAFDQQEMRPGDTYGRMPWNLADKGIQDANSIDFANEALGPILLGHEKALSPSFITYIRPHMVASLAALERHQVPVSYTNIYVMNTTARLLLSEWLHDEAARLRAVERMDAWLEYTRNYGIHEFDSPTYSAVALGSLLMGNLHAAEASEKERYREALNLEWADLGANYFPSVHRIAGSHSRDYDFLFGRGGSDLYFFMTGLSDTPPSAVNVESSMLFENNVNSGYVPKTPAWSQKGSRIIAQLWDSAPSKTRYTYITPGFSIGTANGDYGPQDKMFAVDIAGGDVDVPTISLVTTSSGLPYGKDQHNDPSGHPKPKHLPNHLGAVQKKGFALLAVAPDLTADKKADAYFVDMLLPSVANIAVNGKPLQLSATTGVILHLGDTVGVFYQKTCFAARPIIPEGATAELSIKADKAGLSYGVFRLSARVIRAPRELMVGYLVLAEACRDQTSVIEQLSRATVTSAVSGDSWKLDARVGHEDLSMLYDLSLHAPTSRQVNGTEMTTPVLEVTELPPAP